MKRVVGLGFALIGLLALPLMAQAGDARPPAVLGIERHGGPGVLGIRHGFATPWDSRHHVQHHRDFQHGHHHQGHHRHHGGFGSHHGHFHWPAVVHRQPVWVQPGWAWDGWRWVWVPGYWAW